jgi:extracellular matrix regulatory protein A
VIGATHMGGRHRRFRSFVFLWINLLRRRCGMEKNLLNIGFGNTVVAERVVAIVSPNSAPMKRLKDEARDEKHLVDATHGRRTRSIIVMDSNHIVLSAIQAETISQRFEQLKEKEKESEE